MTMMQHDFYKTITVGASSTLNTEDIEGDEAVAITSSTYEYVEGATDSPYIISSSMFRPL